MRPEAGNVQKRARPRQVSFEQQVGNSQRGAHEDLFFGFWRINQEIDSDTLGVMNSLFVVLSLVKINWAPSPSHLYP